MRTSLLKGLGASAVALLLASCGSVGGSAGGSDATAPAAGGSQALDAVGQAIEVEPGSLEGKKICFNFQSLETEFWAAGKVAISQALAEAGAEVIEMNSNEDANRQFEQINDCVTQKADGIIFIPQDGASANTVIDIANEAGIPVVAFNRPPASEDGESVVVVADNREIAKQAVEYMVEEAVAFHEETGETLQPLVMVGDLGDVNAVDRRDGYYDAMNAAPEGVFEETIEVETNWDATTAQQNLQSALQANPGVDLIFTSSDFMYPQIQAVLNPLGLWQPADTEGHVILGGVDGDNRACNLMRDGYVDATGVQDLFFEAQSAIEGLTGAITGGETHPDKVVDDPGFALTLSNMGEREGDMWGCVIEPPN